MSNLFAKKAALQAQIDAAAANKKVDTAKMAREIELATNDVRDQLAEALLQSKEQVQALLDALMEVFHVDESSALFGVPYSVDNYDSALSPAPKSENITPLHRASWGVLPHFGYNINFVYNTKLLKVFVTFSHGDAPVYRAPDEGSSASRFGGGGDNSKSSFEDTPSRRAAGPRFGGGTGSTSK